jgi:hypothetical protein
MQRIVDGDIYAKIELGAKGRNRETRITKKPREPKFSGLKWGVGVRHALFPEYLHLALSLSRAVDSPTPLHTACVVFDLMAGSLQSLLTGDY